MNQSNNGPENRSGNGDSANSRHNKPKRAYSSEPLFPFLEQDSFRWAENALMKKKYTEIRIWMILLGLISVAFGIFLLFWENFSLLVIGITLAVIFIIIGIFRLIGAFTLRGVPTGWRILSFIVGLLFLFEGGIFFKNMNTSITFLFMFASIFIGITWIFEGFLELFESGSAISTGWSIFSGVVSIIAGFFFLFYPITSMWVFIIFIGSWLIAIGAMAVIRGIILFAKPKEMDEEANEIVKEIREEENAPGPEDVVTFDDDGDSFVDDRDDNYPDNYENNDTDYRNDDISRSDNRYSQSPRNDREYDDPRYNEPREQNYNSENRSSFSPRNNSSSSNTHSEDDTSR